MADRSVPQWLKSTLEIGPVLGFFGVYLWMKDEVYTLGGTEYSGLIVATALFIPVILTCTGILWGLTGRISRMQVFTAVAVTFFGLLSIWLNDDRFLKIRPTLVYGTFAIVLAVGLMRGRSVLRYFMDETMPMKKRGWMILTKRLAWAFAAMAAANEIVWRTQSTEFWVTFETFGLPIALMGFFVAQAKLIETYSKEPEDTAS